ncbi:MAG: J domain-containing protein [Eubacteriales bacterium]|nr:J domain-containing protein [Eubacteriales bacterium]
MSYDPIRFDEVKRKLRKLKKLEVKVRFNGISNPGKILVWDSFFDLHDSCTGNTKYSLHKIASMDQEEYLNVINEYFACVYYELYRENGLTFKQGIYEPEFLSKLGLPFDADENDIKKRFRELAKKYHPDTGGDAALFVELMDNYKKLIT